MPSRETRVNLTLDPSMLDLLDRYKVAHGCRYRATAVYQILWDVLVRNHSSVPPHSE